MSSKNQHKISQETIDMLEEQEPSWSSVPELDCLHLEILNTYHKDNLDPSFITLLMNIVTGLPFTHHDTPAEPVPEVKSKAPKFIVQKSLIDQPQISIKHSSLLIPTIPLKYRVSIGEFSPREKMSALDSLLMYLRHASARLYYSKEFETKNPKFLSNPEPFSTFSAYGIPHEDFGKMYKVFCQCVGIFSPEEQEKQLGVLNTILKDRYKHRKHSGSFVSGALIPRLFETESSTQYLSMLVDDPNPRITLYPNTKIFSAVSDENIPINKNIPEKTMRNGGNPSLLKQLVYLTESIMYDTMTEPPFSDP